MCSKDRIENNNVSQLEFYQKLKSSINHSNHPACIRLRNGTIPVCNLQFTSEFLNSTPLESWLDSIDISTSLILTSLDAEVYSSENQILMEENLSILGQRWDFIVERMDVGDNEFTVWKFCHLRRGTSFSSDSSALFGGKINTFKNSLMALSDIQLETLALYSFGASHQVIADVLNVSVGTSKNRINKITSILSAQSRDEMFYLIHASGIAFSLFRMLRDIVNKRVNRLLIK